MKTALALSLVGLLGACATASGNPGAVPEEDYSFLSTVDGRCLPKIGAKLAPEREAECRRMTGLRHYRGTWVVAFETSMFRPDGKPKCVEGVTLDYCPDLILEGKSLPWPGRWSCARMFAVDFVGRRSVHPGSDLNYRLVVDRLISAKRLPDPPWFDDCDAGER